MSSRPRWSPRPPPLTARAPGETRPLGLRFAQVVPILAQQADSPVDVMVRRLAARNVPVFCALRVNDRADG